MALVVMFFSGFLGVAASLTALVGFDVAWSHALVIYLVTSIVPAALVMAAVHLHTQITRALTSPDTEAQVRVSR
jgi:hypothetical protein